MLAELPVTLASVTWPVLDRFRFGDSFAISPHGIFIAIGFGIGAWVFTKLAIQRGVPEDLANSVVFWSLIGAIVGARVGYVIAHVSEFESPLEWFEVWRGGISLLGGIAGATIANAVNIRRKQYRFRFFQIADTVAPALALGIMVGRIGDLIIADHLGKPTSWLLAWRYSSGAIAPPFSCQDGFCTAQLDDGYVQTIREGSARLVDGAGRLVAEGVGVHQTALYDMLLAGVLFAFLWWFIRSPRREGMVTLTFGLWYGSMRLLEDSLRIDKRFGPLTGSQWTALTVATVCALLLIWFATRKPDGPTTPPRRPLRDTSPAPGEEPPDGGSEPEPSATTTV
ncbi:MAG TPA: prolipoprotein diacylglyceryl transferase family protein [Actinomycetota bacterium]|nr:prolipoprotein diacylglyceryl transferase family protein [Actinomycetota bacterium]